MRLLPISLATLATLLLAGCPADDTTDVPDAGEVSCNCTPETAAMTPYDPTTSLLDGGTVQEAIDEVVVLANRDIATELFSRLEQVQPAITNPGTDTFAAEAPCPEPARDWAVGGTCDFLAQGSLIGTALLNGPTTSGFRCHYQQTAGNTAVPLVTAVCLRRVR